MLGAALHVGHDPAAPHDHHVVAHGQDLRQLRGDHNHTLPGLYHVVHHTVYLNFGAHVDAAGGFVEDEDIGVDIHPLSDDHLLLVAAGELGRNLVQGGRLDLQRLHIRMARLLNLCLVQERPLAKPLHIRQDQIGTHVQGEYQSLSLPVLR